jgi:hypothetical protein
MYDILVFHGDKLYQVTFNGKTAISVYVRIDGRWKSCEHWRRVWDFCQDTTSKKVAAIIAQAVANRDAKKLNKRE